MKTRSNPFVLSLALMGMASAGRAQSFADFVARVEVAPNLAQTALIDSFMEAVPRFPFTETDPTVHFIYCRPAHARGGVRIPMASRRPENHYRPNVIHETVIENV